MKKVVVVQVYDEKDDIEGINDQYWHLRAEAVPEDQLSVSEQDQLMHVYHFTCDQQSHVSCHTLLQNCITSWLLLLCMLFESQAERFLENSYINKCVSSLNMWL